MGRRDEHGHHHHRRWVDELCKYEQGKENGLYLGVTVHTKFIHSEYIHFVTSYNTQQLTRRKYEQGKENGYISASRSLLNLSTWNRFISLLRLT